MTERQVKVIGTHTGKEKKTFTSGEIKEYHKFTTDTKGEIKINSNNPFIADFSFKSLGKYELNWTEDSSSPKKVFEDDDAIILVEPEEDHEGPEEDNNGPNNKVAEKSTVRKYCQENDIQRLEYDEETSKLIITYKSKDKPKSELDNLNQQLQEIKNYLKEKGEKDSHNHKRKFLIEKDWAENQSTPSQDNKTNWTPWLIAGGIGLFIIILVAVIGLVRKSD